MFRRESASATIGQMNNLSEVVVVVFQTARVGSLRRRGGTERQESEVSTVERTSGGHAVGSWLAGGSWALGGQQLLF